MARSGLPVFEMSACDVFVGPTGRLVFVAAGAMPPLDQLEGWSLFVWQEGRGSLAFGGVHRDHADGATPFNVFMRVEGCASTLCAIVDKSRICEMAFVDGAGGLRQNVLWTVAPKGLPRRRPALSGGMGLQ